MNFIKSLSNYLLLMTILVSCNDVSILDPSLPKTLEDVGILKIRDEIIHSSTTPRTASNISDNTFTFEFNETKSFQESKTLDLNIVYFTTSTCDVDVYLYNWSKGRWDQISKSPNAFVCGDAITEHSRLISSLGFNPRQYINDNGTVQVKGGAYYGFTVQLFDIHPDYINALIIKSPGLTYSVVDYSDNTFWSLDYTDNSIVQYTFIGDELARLELPVEDISEFTFFGNLIWLVDRSGLVSAINKETSEIICEFQSGISYPSGIAANDENIWISSNSSADSDIYAFEITSSCLKQLGLIKNQVTISEAYNHGVEWNGNNLLFLDDKLNVLNQDLALLKSYEIPVYNPFNVFWDGSAAILSHYGIVESRGAISVMTRFELN